MGAIIEPAMSEPTFKCITKVSKGTKYNATGLAALVSCPWLAENTGGNAVVMCTLLCYKLIHTHILQIIFNVVCSLKS